jgi:GT2 family glycosyltransferase
VSIRVSVTLVTFDSAHDLGACLDSLARQTAPPVEVVIVDNGSLDDSVSIARKHAVVSHLSTNATNLGFAAAQNQAIRCSAGDWVLTLNPDVVLGPTFLADLAIRAERPPPLGTLCGKLLRLGPDGKPVEPPLIDSTGMVFTRSFRHFDRGSETFDTGQWEREEPVFGASAAAALYRRSMIENVSVDGEFFDEAFFAYREDADVAWRAQLQGWVCLYVPSAVGHHVRRVSPSNRSNLPVAINRHSVTNRFLMRIKNADRAVLRRCGWRGLARDLTVIAGCLTWEWRSLPALWQVIRYLPRASRQRAEIQARRRCSGREIAQWFE